MLIFFVFQFHACLCSSLCQTMKIRCFQCSGHGKIYISFPFSYILWSLSLSLIVLSILSLFRFHSFLLSRVILRVEFCIFFLFFVLYHSLVDSRSYRLALPSDQSKFFRPFLYFDIFIGLFPISSYPCPSLFVIFIAVLSYFRSASLCQRPRDAYFICLF